MYKSDLIAAIANRTLKQDGEVKTIIDAATEIICEQLAAGESITLQGFGTFTVQKRAARTSRNPRTGETLEVAEKVVPTFKAAKALKEAVK